jgi:hypothetical protein
MAFKGFIVLVSAILFFIGGAWWHNARRFLMPLVLTAACWFITHSLWSLSVLASILPLCMGYGEDSPLNHLFGNGGGRSVWGFLVALMASCALFLNHFMPLWGFLGYLVINSILENTLKDLSQEIGDLICGLGLSSFLFLLV